MAKKNDLPSDHDDHHVFPSYRFRSRIIKTKHRSYNAVAEGHRTAWEVARDIREVASASEIVTDEHLMELAKRFGRHKQKGLAGFKKWFDELFGGERNVEKIIAVLNQYPWMLPGIPFVLIPKGKTVPLRIPGQEPIFLDENKVLVIFDYKAIKAAHKNRKDIRGLLPEIKK